MVRLLLIAQESEKQAGLCRTLDRNGMTCATVSYEGAEEMVARQPPDIVLVEMNGRLPGSGTRELIRKLKQTRNLPVMALVSRETLDSLDRHLDFDDFITSPGDARELTLRINRLLHRNGTTASSELIKSNGLVIDLATCEVTVAGRVVELTFKEYELLKLLAGHPGRVFTRESLLNKIWGYDYYGGDRTVDVHVRRLRSKIEGANHTFIETVRNIGYKFRKDR
jgi:two-component system alkaline phosphatase synthesis response regulator PhoP